MRLSCNNFDLLRLLLAVTVCLVHGYVLSGYQALQIFDKTLSATGAVKAFFVVSGFLIFMSYERSSSLKAYFSKRIRRIYPAYFTVVMLSAIGLSLVSTKSMTEYFSADWLRYLVVNLSFLNFLQLSLPGVFEANLLSAVNGALWTLKIEVMFYLAVPLIGLLIRHFSPLPVLAIGYGFSVAYAEFMAATAAQQHSLVLLELSRQLPGQLAYFLAGAFFYYFLPFFERHIRYFLAVAILGIAADNLYRLPLLEPFALATLVAFVGLFNYWGNFGKYGDFSYGVYILHCPIIQLLIQSGWFTEQPWHFLAAVIGLTVLGAIALWHLVEKRFLLRNNHYIMTTSNAVIDT